MRSYRCYFLNLRTTIPAVGSIEAETDAEAVKQAEALFRAKGAGFTGMEVWVGGRRVPHELDDSSAQIGRWRMKAEELLAERRRNIRIPGQCRRGAAPAPERSDAGSGMTLADPTAPLAPPMTRRSALPGRCCAARLEKHIFVCI